MLKMDIKYVAYHHATDYYMTAVNDEELMPQLGGVVDIHKTSLKLYSKYEFTCALALFGTDLEDIQTHCGYTVVFDDLPPSVVRINANKLLLTNVTQILVERRSRENVTMLHQQINFTEAHVIYKMNRNRTAENIDSYQKTIKTAASDYWKTFCGTLHRTTKLSTVWNMAKRMNGVTTCSKP